MLESNLSVKIRKEIIDELDNIRTARMTRTEFINTILAKWLLKSHGPLRAEGPCNPGRMDWDLWRLNMSVKHRRYQQTVQERVDAAISNQSRSE